MSRHSWQKNNGTSSVEGYFCQWLSDGLYHYLSPVLKDAVLNYYYVSKYSLKLSRNIIYCDAIWVPKHQFHPLMLELLIVRHTVWIAYKICIIASLHWRQNERDGASNHRPLKSLLNRLLRRRKHQSPGSLAFVREIHRWPVDSLHKGSVTKEMFPFDDVIMWWLIFLPKLLL